MYKLFSTMITLVIIGLGNMVIAQTPNWLREQSAGSVNYDETQGFCTDADGNVILSGQFQNAS